MKKISFLTLTPPFRWFILSILAITALSACSNYGNAPDASLVPTTTSNTAHILPTPHTLKGVQLGQETLFTLPQQTSIKNLVDISSTVWFGEHDINKIGKINVQGQLSEYTLPTTNAQPNWGTSGPDGNFWFSEENANRVAQISSQGAITEYALPTANAKPGQMLLWGNLVWFTETGTHKLGRLNQDNQIVEFSLNGTPDQITSAGSEEQNGLLWFSEPAIHKIGHITFDGQISEFPLPASVTKLGNIVGDGDSNLWFATGQSTHNQIGYVTPDGHFTFFSTNRPNATTQLLWNSSTILFTEQNNNTIWTIDKQGTIQPSLAAPTNLSLPTPLTPDPTNGSYWYTKTSGQQSQLGNLNISPYGP